MKALQKWHCDTADVDLDSQADADAMLMLHTKQMK
jgi:hypothetical protein